MTTTTTTTADVPSRSIECWHGTCGNPAWTLPKCIAQSDIVARPKYGKVPASEYRDASDVFDQKIDMAVAMIKASQELCAYTGAGLSTSAGIPDYASKAEKSSVVKHLATTKGMNMRLAVPTVAHRCLAAMEKKGHLKHWLQQNHDGLAQKAGFPREKLNEIHGSWWDDTNPVVKMSGTLRADLYQWMLDWEERADCVLGLGTSFSGMSADCVAKATAMRFLKEAKGQGLIIVNLQETQMDNIAQLRIYAPLDEVLSAIAKKLKITRLDTVVHTPYPKPNARRSASKPRP